MKVIVGQNVEKLNNFDFDKLTKKVNLYEGENGECIQYLFLMANAESGEIIDITHRQKFQEEAVSALLSVTKASLLEESPHQLKLHPETDQMHEDTRKIIEVSLKKFNEDNT